MRWDSRRAGKSSIALLRQEANRDYDNYLWLLNDDGEGGVADPGREGISRELARIGLGLNAYTQWYWKVDLHNLLGFLRLRADAHAQFEIRAYASVLLEIVEQWVPAAFDAFKEHRLGAASLSATALRNVRAMLQGEDISFEKSGMGKREWAEFQALLRSSDDNPI